MGASPLRRRPFPDLYRLSYALTKVQSVVKFTATSWRACNQGRGSSPQPWSQFPGCDARVWRGHSRPRRL